MDGVRSRLAFLLFALTVVAASIAGGALLAPKGTSSGSPPAAIAVAESVNPESSIEPMPGSVTATPGPPAPSDAMRAPTAAPTARAIPEPTPRPTPRTTPKPTPRPVPPQPTAACPLFPSTNVWNTRVDGLPLAANSATLVATIGATAPLHPDFGSYAGYGIPYNIVGRSTATSAVSFDYVDESDAGPYPIPASPRIEVGSDRHLLMWDTDACRLYELYAAVKTSSGWHAGSGAIWDLRSNALRPDGWTSADAAGLPILPGLVRYDEVRAGAIRHAIRFTAPETRSSHIYPARHDAGDGLSASLPPMGTRLRLKASFDVSGFPPQARVILTAMKQYGIILADNGSPWYFQGASDPRFSDDQLNELKSLTGSDFEVVDTSGLRNG